MHVVLRVAKEVGNLRRKDVWLAMCKATERVGGVDEFRIVHMSVQSTHVHMLVEAADERALSWHMQRFQISAARLINATVRDGDGKRRRGMVFTDRFHASIITSPKQARHVIGYVLSNFRKHHEDRSGVARTWKIDWFSSAVAFTGWAEYQDADFPRSAPAGYVPLCVSEARTWLAREGWRLAGEISCFDEPSRTKR